MSVHKRLHRSRLDSSRRASSTLHGSRLSLCICSLACCLVCPPPARASSLGQIEGVVRDFEGLARPGVQVELLRAGGAKADEHATGADGRFSFERVPFGRYLVTATASDGRRDQREVKLASGERVQVELFLPLPGQEVVIEVETRKVAPPARDPGSSSSLDRGAIEDLPRGDSSAVNELLATQPGFVFDAMGNLFARGNHGNVQYQLDGVPLPDSVSGLFGSLVSPRMVEELEVRTGGLPAQYGDRLAAVVNLNSRRPAEQAALQLDLKYGADETFSPSLLFTKHAGPLSILAGGSSLTTQRALDPQVFGDLSHDGGDQQRLFLKLDYVFSHQTSLTLLGVFAHSFYRIPIDTSVNALDPALPGGGRAPDAYGNSPPAYLPHDTNQSENERDLFTALSLHHDEGPLASTTASLSFRRSWGRLLGDAAHALGATQDPCASDGQGGSSCATASDVTRSADHFGLDLGQTLRLGEHHSLEAGLQLDQLFGTTDYTSYTRSDALGGPDPALTVSGLDRAHATTFGLFLQDRATLGAWVIDAGVRLDLQRVSFAGTSEAATHAGFGPRLGASYAISPDTIVHAFAGLLWQPPPVLDTPAAARILGVVTPDRQIAYDLLPEKDRYGELGLESRLLPSLSIKLTAWGRLVSDQLDDIAVGSTNLLSPYNFRDGRAAGLEGAASLVVLSGHLTAFANGTFEVAEGRGIETARYLFASDALSDAGWQTLDHVQSWTANAGATAKDGLTRLSALLGYGSGLRTGPSNSAHVPGHLRTDLSLSHQFVEAPGKPTFAIDVLNLFDARYYYRIANGFSGSATAPGRSLFVRVGLSL
jgi:TonB dependent receptor/Carboxypeptidase regulatory-like domain/TonB-dependent Receptor Plug Domain